MKTSESIDAFAEAMCKAQSEMGGAVKGSENPFFKSSYSDLGAVIDAIRAPFAAHGLCFVQGASYADGCVTVTTRLMHESGQWLEDSLAVPAVKLDPQGLGSAISYGKRYSLQSLVGCASVDDDGEQAHGRAPSPATKAVEQDVITTAQAAQVRASMESLGMDESQVTGYYKVASVDLMTPAMFEHVSKTIKKRSAA